jgi:hypothetical protein
MNKSISVDIDPFAGLNDNQMADALSAVIVAFKAGDQAVTNALNAYTQATDVRIEDLEAALRLEPKKVEEEFKRLLSDPNLLAMLSGAVATIPGTSTSIGSFCAALLNAPEKASALFTQNSSGEFIGAVVTLVRNGVETVVPFTPATEAFDEDLDGFSEREVQTWTGEAYGLTLTFSHTAALRQKLLGAGFQPLVLRTRVGHVPMHFDLSASFTTVTPVTVNAGDIDGDGFVGVPPAPAPAPEGSGG